MTIANIVLLFAALAVALRAGLFYTWSISVMPGFARLSDREFISAMQATNRAIQNPIFFAAFFGAPILLPIAALLHYGQSPRFWSLLGATVIYSIGTFGVTVFGNVPLNNRLDGFDLKSASDEEVSSQRANFETSWNNLNAVRTVSSALAVVLAIIACLN